MGGFCTVSCAPFVIPYILADSNSKFLPRIFIFCQFLFGRLAAYILFAAVVSFISISSEDFLTMKVNNILLIAGSLLMITFALFKIDFRFCQISGWSKATRGFPLLTGFLLGLNLCPPFLIAIIKVLNMHSMLNSCLYFLFLFIGTTIYLIPVAFASALFKSEFFKRMGTYLAILVGIWFLIQGITGLL